MYTISTEESSGQGRKDQWILDDANIILYSNDTQPFNDYNSYTPIQSIIP